MTTKKMKYLRYKLNKTQTGYACWKLQNTDKSY